MWNCGSSIEILKCHCVGLLHAFAFQSMSNIKNLLLSDSVSNSTDAAIFDIILLFLERLLLYLGYGESLQRGIHM